MKSFALIGRDAKVLNITNGEYFNDYFLERFGGAAVPFCEVMMDGDTLSEIYSDAFVLLRSSQLNVGVEEYRLKMHVYSELKHKKYFELRLWFGKDTFCQINLLTLLAYLEQISYSGTVVLNYIDDETFEVIERGINVQLGMYRKIYEDVLLLKRKPKELGVLSSEGIDLYFDYVFREGKLDFLIKENLEMEQNALVCLVLENSKEYGLSDLQAEKMIASYKKECR